MRHQGVAGVLSTGLLFNGVPSNVEEGKGEMGEKGRRRREREGGKAAPSLSHHQRAKNLS